MTRYSVSVPATTANLGPGYDSFGLALELRNDFHAQLADTWSVEVSGEGAQELPRDDSNLLARGMKAIFERAGHPELKAHIECVNRVPLGSGLGSSSTALVGGGVLARMLLHDVDPSYHLSDEELIVILAHMEGHPDNVAPAFHGGFTICWTDPESADAGADAAADIATDTEPTPRCERFQLVSPMAAVIVPSSAPLATSYARTLIPETIPHKDAVFNLSHAGLLAAALTSGRLELLHLAIEDKLHQPYRAPAIPDYETIRDILKNAGADAVAFSGAGPTIIAFVTGLTANSAYLKAQEIAAATTDAIAALEHRQTPQAVNFALRGVLPL